MTDEPLSLIPIRREQPGTGRLLRLLDSLSAPSGAETLLLAAGAGAEAVLRPSDGESLVALLTALVGKSGRAASGLALFWSPAESYIVRPPLPPAASQRTAGWDTAPLLDIVGRPRTVAVFLLRRGGYAVGVFQGDLLVSAKNGARFVKNRHRKGGQSQRRFDRIREKQVDELFAKACAVARERLEPYQQALSALFLGGDRHTVQACLKDCSYVGGFGDRLQARFITTPEPRHDTLTLAYAAIWRSDWTELRPGTAETTERDVDAPRCGSEREATGGPQ